MTTIGKMIKQRREALGFTQQELADKLGYKSRSAINKIETGVNDITQSKIVKFAEVLETTPAYLMGWAEEKDGYAAEQPPQAAALHLTNGLKEKELLTAFAQLNTVGKEEAIKRVLELSEVARYRR